MKYPHLLETTMLGYQQRTYTMGLGVSKEDLSEEEVLVLKQSEQYVEKFEIERDRKLLKDAYEAFEKLRDIEGLPEEALSILREWTFREEDEE